MSAAGNAAGRIIAAIVGNPHATVADIAADTDLSIRTVRRHINRLERDGAFMREYNGGHIHYRLNPNYVVIDHFTIGDMMRGHTP